MKETIYHVAMYLRLSRDDDKDRMVPLKGGGIGSLSGNGDGNIKSESNSISSQRELIRSHIRMHEDMELYDVYVDDGFTGSNFDRPDFKRMMEDIDGGRVNCVIVKDLSRFGRDYIEAGRYIQKEFPAKKVRFVAITDHFDSLTAESSESSIVLPVKNFINDSYCRDISVKARSQKKIKMQNGEYIGPFALYGYRKDAKHKGLEVDEYASQVVKGIFTWKMEGMSAHAIARKLDDLGILSPMEYKRSLGENFCTGFTGSGNTKWSSMAVNRILTNEAYLGHLVQGKRENVSHKIRKPVEKPCEEWIRAENAHEAIIEADDFEVVQELLKTDSRASVGSREGSLFSGILFCHDCEEQMVKRASRRKGLKKAFYTCSTYNRGEGCSRHNVFEEDLKDIIFTELRAYVNAFLEQGRLLDELRKQEANFDVIQRYDKEILRMRKEQDKFYRLCDRLNEDLASGILTEKEYKKLRATYMDSARRLEASLKSQEELIQKLFKQGIASGVRLAKFDKVQELTQIDRLTLVGLVQGIYILEQKRIKVQFRFRNEFECIKHIACVNEEQKAPIDELRSSMHSRASSEADCEYRVPVLGRAYHA